MITTLRDHKGQSMQKVHAGEIILLDVLEPLGLTVEEAAPLFGVSVELLADITACKAPVTSELAQGLEAQGYSTARMWLALQKAYEN